MGQITRFDGHIEPDGCIFLLYAGFPHQVVQIQSLQNKTGSMLLFYRNALPVTVLGRLFKYHVR
jgi:hypothetical protein